MAAATQPYGTSNAHTATIDSASYKCTDLSLDDGGTTEDVMAGSDAGHGRDLPTSKRTNVSATILVPATGDAGVFRAMEEYTCTFTKKASNVSVTGSFLVLSKRYAGATASALKYECSFVSQGEATWTIETAGA